MDQQSAQQHASSGQTDSVCRRQHAFPCLEGQIILAIDQYDTCGISVPSACKVLGVNARSQQQRIARTQGLAQACQQIVLPTRGGPQRITCLKVEQVSAWLLPMTNVRSEQHLLFLQAVTDAAAALYNEAQTKVHRLELPLYEESMVEIWDPQAIATTLPGLGPILIGPSHAEDRAIREAALARLRESTILTARYILGRWNIAREQGQPAPEGSAPIRIEEILEWRGLQKHSRAIAPGSAIRRVEDFVTH